jgi:predicted glutamine amidotransferase
MDKVLLTPEFIGTVRDAVCATNDRDGFGYAVVNHMGMLGGERTTDPFPFKAFEDRKQTVTNALPIVKGASDTFGTIDTHKPKAFIGHGRMSTNDINLANTHPFYNGDVALIHNGVVYDESDSVKDLKTTCDTEILLKLWESGGMDAIEDSVSGYYAMALLDTNGLLHVVRDDRARLFIAWSETTQSFLIATTIDIIQSIAAKMQWVVDQPKEIVDNIHVIFDGNTILSQTEINPLGYAAIPTGQGQASEESKIMAALGETETYEGFRSDTEYQELLDKDDYYDKARELNDDDMPDYDNCEIVDIVDGLKLRRRVG